MAFYWVSIVDSGKFDLPGENSAKHSDTKVSFQTLSRAQLRGPLISLWMSRNSGREFLNFKLFYFALIQSNKNQGLSKNACVSSVCEISMILSYKFSQSFHSFEMTLMIVTFFYAFGIDFGNFLNARLNHFLSKRFIDKMH